MKKFLVPTLALLTLSPFAAACPVKKGYVVNGLVKDTMKFEPLCGMVPTFKTALPSAKWMEAWGTTNDKTGGMKVISVLNALKSQGFKQASVQDTSKGRIWQLVKGSKVVVIMTGVNDPLVFIAIGGN